MASLKRCPFCGGVGALSTSASSTQKSACVLCTHCSARGSVYTTLVTLQGTFEDTPADLKTAAITAWNGARE